ncbi:unnamed protein product [Cuscuta europaea]|uniref:DUF8039 domain-containing protein n=1 Tax=Cuscuta europaea TaxID=41803 RepID=A0A9P0YID2_CUSEU|nr:unnamed protein product [Cuscuta europaea]
MRVDLLKELRQEMQENNTSHSKEEDHIILRRVSTGGSNFVPEFDDGDESDDDNDLHELFIDTPPPHRLVAKGKIHDFGDKIHHQTVGLGNVRVEVVKVLEANAPVPIPSGEVQTAGQAPKNFIAWPRRLLKDVKTQVSTPLVHIQKYWSCVWIH